MLAGSSERCSRGAGSGAVYFLHESLHGAGAPEAMRIQLRREIPLEPFETAARSLLAT